MQQLQVVTNEDPSLLRSEGDFALVNRLLQNARYRIPEHLRDKAVASIEEAFDEPDNSISLKLKAVQCLATLDKQNIEIVKLAIPKKVEHITPSKMSDEELHDQIREIAKCLPKPIEATYDLIETP